MGSRIARSIAEEGSARPDYDKALSILGEIAASGSVQDAGVARSLMEAIRTPVLEVSVANAFRPGSQAQLEITRRNCPSAEIAIYPLDPELLPGVHRLEKPVRWPRGWPFPRGSNRSGA
jgi:hypothetical protein